MTTREGAKFRMSASNGAPESSDFPKRPIQAHPGASLCCKRRLEAVVCQFRTGTDSSNPLPSTNHSLAYRTFRRIERNLRVCAGFAFACGPRDPERLIHGIRANLSGRDFFRSISKASGADELRNGPPARAPWRRRAAP
jgi:hypothetical protein